MEAWEIAVTGGGGEPSPFLLPCELADEGVTLRAIGDGVVPLPWLRLASEAPESAATGGGDAVSAISRSLTATLRAVGDGVVPSRFLLRGELVGDGVSLRAVGDGVVPATSSGVTPPLSLPEAGAGDENGAGGGGIGA